ncbi:MAG: hypothetical protein IJ228_10320 [Succinivibrio sp.]|nr:hypothetical protein [Succinivibrio sp.]
MTAIVKISALKAGTIAAALGLMSAQQAFAISDGIRSNREAECAIWLCLPGGFGEGCSAAREAYYKRIHDLNWKGQRKYTDVPSMSVCHDDNPEGIEDTHLEPKLAPDFLLVS